MQENEHAHKHSASSVIRKVNNNNQYILQHTLHDYLHIYIMAHHEVEEHAVAPVDDGGLPVGPVDDYLVYLVNGERVISTLVLHSIKLFDRAGVTHARAARQGNATVLKTQACLVFEALWSYMSLKGCTPKQLPDALPWTQTYVVFSRLPPLLSFWNGDRGDYWLALGNNLSKRGRCLVKWLH